MANQGYIDSFAQKIDLAEALLSAPESEKAAYYEKYETILSTDRVTAEQLIRANELTFKMVLNPVVFASVMYGVFSTAVTDGLKLQSKLRSYPLLLKIVSGAATKTETTFKLTRQVYDYLKAKLLTNFGIEVLTRSTTLTLEQIKEELSTYNIEVGSGDEDEVYEGDTSGVKFDDDELDTSTSPNIWNSETIAQVIGLLKLVDNFENISGQKIGMTEILIQGQPYNLKFVESKHSELDTLLTNHSIIGNTQESFDKSIEKFEMSFNQFINYIEAFINAKLVSRTFKILKSGLRENKYAISFLLSYAKDFLNVQRFRIATTFTADGTAVPADFEKYNANACELNILTSVFDYNGSSDGHDYTSAIACMTILAAMKSDKFVDDIGMEKKYNELIDKLAKV